MSKKSEGIVVEVYGEYAVVTPTAHVGCDQTYCCQGDGVTKVNAEMINTVQAQVGEKVIFVAKETNMLKAAFIVYILPLILILSGAGAGYSLAPMVGMAGGIGAGIGGVLLLGASVAIIKGYDNYASNNRNMKPEIIEIVK